MSDRLNFRTKAQAVAEVQFLRGVLAKVEKERGDLLAALVSAARLLEDPGACLPTANAATAAAAARSAIARARGEVKP